MFSEEDLLPLSALQHTLFCERQCALIHNEQLWAENRFTAEGKVLHERVDAEHRERRKLRRTEYSLHLRSLVHGLIGIADVVEVTLKEEGGYQSIVPVEYKRGTDKIKDVDRVQLLAQSLCLEEMFGVPVPYGEFYYLQDHRRTSVDFTDELRITTLQTIERTRHILTTGETPWPVYEKAKCDRCSLFDLCMPKTFEGGGKKVSRYVQSQMERSRTHA